MPGWLIHLGFAYILAKILKIRDIIPILIGSILPDVSKVSYITECFGILNTTQYAFLEPFHTPFISLVLILAISFLFKQPGKAFLLTSLGAITHYVLDHLQSTFYIGRTLFYPFSYYAPKNINLFWPDSTLAIVLSIIGTGILIYAIFEENKKPLRLTHKKLYLFFLFLVIAILVPVFTFNTFLENEPYINQFKTNKTEMYFAYSLISSENPLLIKEIDYEYEIQNQIDVKKGDFISARAKFKTNKVIIEEYHIHDLRVKEQGSFIAAILFIILILKYPKRYK